MSVTIWRRMSQLMNLSGVMCGPLECSSMKYCPLETTPICQVTTYFMSKMHSCKYFYDSTSCHQYKDVFSRHFKETGEKKSMRVINLDKRFPRWQMSTHKQDEMKEVFLYRNKLNFIYIPTGV